MTTMVGTGGVGKTRFALRLAADVAHAFPDGVWLAELSDLAKTTDSPLLEQTVAEVFGLSCFSVQRPGKALTEHLADRRCLLILDNCEHLADEVATLVSHLLRTSNALHVMVTSRKILGCAGEHVISIPPLHVPDVGAVPGGEALELFQQRAAAIGAPVTSADRPSALEICRRLDGLPLAIELAAARLSSLSVEEVLERLEDRFRLLTGGTRPGNPTHQTLRQVMEWSHQLCSEREQLLWERASIFTGGLDLDAAEAVCAGAGIAAEEVLDTLTGLVRQSVLTVERHGGRTRYRMLETVRQYGARLLERRGQEPEFRARHRDYYRRLVADAAEDWFGPMEVRWLQWAHAEMPNLRAALEYGSAQLDPTPSLEMAINLARLRIWFFSGWPGEGRAWLDRALRCSRNRLADDEATQALRLAATSFAGWISLCQGDRHAAHRYLLECQALPGRDSFGAADFFDAAYVLLVGSERRSIAMFARVVDTLRAVSAQPADMAMAATMHSIAASFLADPEDALTISERHLDDSVREQGTWQTSWAQWSVSLARSRHGDHQGGLRAARKSLRAQWDIGDQWGTVWGTHAVAWLMVADLRATLRHGQKPDPATAGKIARILGGAHQLRQFTGVDLAGLEPLRTATAEAEQFARRALGDHAYPLAFEQGKFPGEHRADAYRHILELTLDERRPKATPSTASTDSAERLTERETEIVALVARGATDAQIAQRLVISIRTAQTHVANILRKRGVRNRRELAAWYLREHPRPAP
ncbi:LuxR C-terminal-related transcriptional regulator [Pseudonocardia spinosispora]|uniref:LuxR C-terminal-related transcriptional regulator n=1 Tax=Pseudonocardia spinosispora TaxID=103441 RepID=UPI0024819564|nr:LuxR C-terminal-related transcriptional regulator [Pseudonocardia spinosispora]